MPISLQMGRGVDDVFAVYKIRREDLLNLSSLFLISYQKVLWVFSNLE